MNSSDVSPKLPTWLFIVTDVALVGLAIMIATQAGNPMSKTAILAIVGCIGLGTILGLVPLIVRLERQKNEMLDDRQRALESLARTVSASAEQISIAASGLHEIAEIAQKNLRQAEQLPHKLQEKIAEFQAQLSTAEDAEKEELERELLSLRTTESERLESVSQRIAKSSAEWAKLETASQQHLAAANEALTKLGLGTASAIGKAQAAAEQALGQARVEAARHVGDASAQAVRAIENTKTAALADLEAKLTSATTTAVERIAQALETRTSRVETSAPITRPPDETPAVAANMPATSSDSVGASAAPSPEPAPAEVSPKEEATSLDPAAPPVKRARKPRREVPAAPEVSAPASSASAPENAPAQSAEPPSAAQATPPGEPPPIPAEKIPEVAPVAPHTADPFTHPATNGSSTHGAESAPPPSEQPKTPRKRSPSRKPEPADPGLGLELDQSSVAPSVSLAERVITSDGATRLIVTAYIGIGNRLFIRGQGPGLTWEKGVPLQFVSIGKWRWETNDANSPIQFKLYKNDDLECAALGAQTLDPGHQQELTAAF